MRLLDNLGCPEVTEYKSVASRFSLNTDRRTCSSFRGTYFMSLISVFDSPGPISLNRSSNCHFIRERPWTGSSFLIASIVSPTPPIDRFWLLSSKQSSFFHLQHAGLQRKFAMVLVAQPPLSKMATRTGICFHRSVFSRGLYPLELFSTYNDQRAAASDIIYGGLILIPNAASLPCAWFKCRWKLTCSCVEWLRGSDVWGYRNI